MGYGIKTDGTARMLGKSNRFGCGCCRDDAKVPSRRASRRRERQAWKKSVRNLDMRP